MKIDGSRNRSPRRYFFTSEAPSRLDTITPDRMTAKTRLEPPEKARDSWGKTHPRSVNMFDHGTPSLNTSSDLYRHLEGDNSNLNLKD